MKDATYAAIADALDRLCQSEGRLSSLKLNGVNLAKEAGISKATLYRYFDFHENLREAYDAARKRGAVNIPEAPTSGVDALRAAEREIADLREIISERDALVSARNAQLFLLWSENRALSKELERKSLAVGVAGNVSVFLGPKR